MTERVTGRGRCLCGAIAYETTGPLRPVINCHCSRCRRNTGHYMAATACGRGELHIGDTSTLRWYAVEGRSYGFCETCGSTLFWKADESPELISIAAGTLDTPTGLETDHAIFTDYAADYHTLDPAIESFPGRRAEYT